MGAGAPTTGVPPMNTAAPVTQQQTQKLEIKQQYRIQCSPVPVSATSLSSDSTLFTLGTVEGSILLYNLETKKVMKQFNEVHDLPVTCVASRPVPNMLMLPGPTLIKAQREVAAYERKRGRVDAATSNRSGTASIFAAATFGEKIVNAAKYAAAGAREAASKTELAMIERQILGFKEEFGVEMYPIFESMEDNEGWLPTDRKVRSLYDSAREDIAKMYKSKEEKREKIKRLDGVEGSGLTPPAVPVVAMASTPTVVAAIGQASWASTDPVIAAKQRAAISGYGSSSTQPPPVQSSFGSSMEQTQQLPPQQQQPPNDGGFGFMGSQSGNNTAMQTPAATSMPQYTNNPVQQQQPQQQQSQQNHGAVFDPFDRISSNNSNANSSLGASYNDSAQQPANNAFDPFSGGNNQSGGGNNQALSDADMNLFKY